MILVAVGAGPRSRDVKNGGAPVVALRRFDLTIDGQTRVKLHDNVLLGTSAPFVDIYINKSSLRLTTNCRAAASMARLVATITLTTLKCYAKIATRASLHSNEWTA